MFLNRLFNAVEILFFNLEAPNQNVTTEDFLFTRKNLCLPVYH